MLVASIDVINYVLGLVCTVSGDSTMYKLFCVHTKRRGNIFYIVFIITHQKSQNSPLLFLDSTRYKRKIVACWCCCRYEQRQKDAEMYDKKGPWLEQKKETNFVWIYSVQDK